MESMRMEEMRSEAEPEQLDVVIIGAGISGISAA